MSGVNKWIIAGAVGALIPVAVMSAATASPALVAQINALKVAPENASPYSRAKFPEQTVGGCTTRARVLKQESLAPVTANANCTVKTGKWVSVWDGKTYTLASKLQVDHTVALSEAWDSGAQKWTTAKRKSYANDLAHRETLNAITSKVNAVKGDSDAAEWLPAKNRCKYAKDTATIKARWALTVDAVEKAALLKVAKGCK